MDKKSEEYLRQYIKLTDTIKQKIEAHAARYHIKAEICAFYGTVVHQCQSHLTTVHGSTH